MEETSTFNSTNMVRLSSPKSMHHLRRLSTPILNKFEESKPSIGVRKPFHDVKTSFANHQSGNSSIHYVEDAGNKVKSKDVLDQVNLFEAERNLGGPKNTDVHLGSLKVPEETGWKLDKEKLQHSRSPIESNVSSGELSLERVPLDRNVAVLESQRVNVLESSTIPSSNKRLLSFPLDKNVSVSDDSLIHDKEIWLKDHQQFTQLKDLNDCFGRVSHQVPSQNIRVLQSDWKMFSNSQVTGKDKLNRRSSPWKACYYRDLGIDTKKIFLDALHQKSVHTVKEEGNDLLFANSSAIYHGLRRLLEDLQNNSLSLERENNHSSSSSSKGNSLSKSFQLDEIRGNSALCCLSLDSVSSYDTVTPDVKEKQKAV